jgi:ABC-type lipoprotein export system ATPase subunit
VAERVAATPLVLVEDLTRRFGSDPPVDALVDITFQVDPGEWVAIVGRSGSGKSTLLNVLGCLDVPTSGSYRFEGIEVSNLSDQQRAGLRGGYIGFVFQGFHLLSHRTVTENVMLAEVYQGQSSAGRRERATAALDRVGLSHRVDFLPTHLSGGESQRVAIARALMGSPHLILCDEPTGNLDSGNTSQILDLFDELNREGATIIMITHERDVAERARRRITLVDGRLQGAA